MSSISKLIDEFKDIAEWKQFCEAQQRTINELSKKVMKLEDEKKSLESTIKHFNPSNQLILPSSPETLSEEIICIKQLTLLKEISDVRELTMEETKKTQIFSDILNKIKSNKKDASQSLQKLTDEELLSLMNAK